MKRLYVSIFFIHFIFGGVEAQTYKKFLDQLFDYQDSVRLIESSINGQRVLNLDTNTFNLKDYMSIFSKLTPKPGYILEYIYRYTGDGGMPLLYARQSNFVKEEYISAESESIRVLWDSIMNERIEEIENEDWEEEEKNKRIKRMKRICVNTREVSVGNILQRFAWDSMNHAVRHLIPRDNKMGYFQLLIFKLYDNNFALWWHANYNYRFPVYKKEQIEFLIKENREGDFSIYLDEKEIVPLLTKNLKPRVKMERDRCLITLYVFYAEGGIYRNTYSISRVTPYLIQEERSEKLVTNSVRGFY